MAKVNCIENPQCKLNKKVYLWVLNIIRVMLYLSDIFIIYFY